MVMVMMVTTVMVMVVAMPVVALVALSNLSDCLRNSGFNLFKLRTNEK
jgi:hypothetical protein